MLRKAYIVLVTFVLVSAARAESPTTLGLLSDVTGLGAANGMLCRDGYEAAQSYYQDVIQRNKVRFVFGDHRGDPKTGVSEFSKMVEQDGAIGVLSNRANVGLAMNAISKRTGVPLIGAMAHRALTADNPVGYRTWPTPLDEGKILSSEARKVGGRAALLVYEEEYLLSLASSFSDNFTALGGTIVSRDLFSESETDIMPLISRMRRLKPDLIFISGAVGQLGPFVRRLREQGLRQPLFSNFWIGYPEVLSSAGADNIHGATFVTADYRRTKFQQALATKTASPPTAVAYACFSAVALALQAIEQSGVEKRALSVDRFVDALNAVKNLELPDESLPFVDREAQFVLAVKRIGEPF